MVILKKSFPTKYRPNNIDGMIILPRIKKELLTEDKNIRLTNNFLFSGTSGIGKTSLAKVLVPKGALMVNASFNSSVEDLKDKVTEYCKTADIFDDSSISGYKIVFLDEFDGVSTKYQEALRAFIEEYENRVRFIATCNNISKIIPALQSRFTIFDFDPKNDEEINFLKTNYLERCKLICGIQEINLTDANLKSIINSNFPDLRAILKTLQRIKITGLTDNNNGNNLDLFDLLFDQKIGTVETYNWVISNFGDNVQNLLKQCGRPLSEYIMEHKKEKINIIPQIVKITSSYLTDLQNAIDPVVLAVSCVFELKTIINK
jgi:replication-associated recombination protein RarA